MGILGWVIFGFAVGLIARALLPGDDTLGVIGTTTLGIVGALIGGWTGQALGWYRPGQGAGFVSATVGSILLLSLRRFGSSGGTARRSSNPGKTPKLGATERRNSLINKASLRLLRLPLSPRLKRRESLSEMEGAVRGRPDPARRVLRGNPPGFVDDYASRQWQRV